MPDIRTVETTDAKPVLTPWVEAAVPYLADLSIKPVTYNPPLGKGVPRRDGNYRDFKVRIHDARLIGRDLSLDRQAFVLAQHDDRCPRLLRPRRDKPAPTSPRSRR